MAFVFLILVFFIDSGGVGELSDKDCLLSCFSFSLESIESPMTLKLGIQH